MIRFQTVQEALLAVSADKLSNVTYTAKEVHVFTVHGTGTFALSEWLAERGPAPTVRTDPGGAA